VTRIKNLELVVPNYQQQSRAHNPPAATKTTTTTTTFVQDSNSGMVQSNLSTYGLPFVSRPGVLQNTVQAPTHYVPQITPVGYYPSVQGGPPGHYY